MTSPQGVSPQADTVPDGMVYYLTARVSPGCRGRALVHLPKAWGLKAGTAVHMVLKDPVTGEVRGKSEARTMAVTAAVSGISLPIEWKYKPGDLVTIALTGRDAEHEITEEFAAIEAILDNYRKTSVKAPPIVPDRPVRKR